MRCFIKNIPPPAFGIAGNRGIGFPLTDYCSTLEQPIIEVTDCYLVKEEDGTTNILTEIEREIAVTCTNPEVGACYIVLQEDPNIWLGQQEDGDVIFCSSLIEILPSECWLVTQEDSNIYIGDQENEDYIFVSCQNDTTYLATQEDRLIAIVDQESRNELLIEY